MKFGLKIPAALIALGVATMPITSAFAQNKVALHATQEEIDIWNQRRANGPYLDDWNRIKANADAFKSNPTGKWTGNELNAPWIGRDVQNCKQLPNVYPGGSSSACRGIRTHGVRIRDAGFVYMLTNDTSYSTPVRKILLEQAAIPGTNFANTTKWPTKYLSLTNNGWAHDDHQITIWLRELLYAYSYTRKTFSGTEQATMNAWFNAAASWFRTVLHDEIDYQFPDRLSGSWTQPAYQGGYQGITHLNGHTTYGFGYPWNNKRVQYSALIGAIGAETGDATSILHAKTHVKEWLMFVTYSDGTIWDQDRWKDDNNPQSGWLYATTAFGAIITTVDHIARTGDTELYTWSTSAGRYGTAGGPKSLLKVLQRYANLQFHSATAYASNTSTSDSWKRINADGESPNTVIKRYVSDLAVCQANVFYKDALVQKLCTRATPTSPHHGGYNPWGGDWGNLPGVRFMFAQMEAKVSPYSSGAGGVSSAAPQPPSGLAVKTQ